MAAARLSLGELVRRARQARGLTQVQLSALSGLPQTRISRIENNSLQDPDLATLVALGRHLGTSVRKLQTAARRTDRNVDERVADLESFSEVLAQEIDDLKAFFRNHPGSAATS